MNRGWKIFQHPTFLGVGLILSLLSGFLVGGAVALATSAWYLSFLTGVVIVLWVAYIYFEAGHE